MKSRSKKEFFNEPSFYLRNVADKSIALFLKTLYLPLIVCEILNVHDTAALFVCAVSAVVFVIHLTNNIRDKVFNVIVAAQTAVALLASTLLSNKNDNYWLLHLIVLFLLNYLLLPPISRRFSIPNVELSIISLIFLNLFLINSFS